MSKQPLILVRPYTPTDMAILGQTYNVHRLWEATDKVSFLRTFGPGVRALATDGEHDADAATMDLLPDLELIASFGVGLDAIDLARTAAKYPRRQKRPRFPLARASNARSVRSSKSNHRYPMEGCPLVLML